MADLLGTKESYGTSLALERGSSILLYLSIGLFFLVGAAFGGLLLLNRAQKESHVTLLGEVNKKEEDLKSDILRQIFLLEGRLKGLRTLLSAHIFPSNVIKLLERDTLPQVRFLNFNFDAASGRLDMTGEAASYSVLARQINVFERDPQIEQVEFGGLSILGGANLAGFKLTIIVKPSSLTSRQ